MEAGESHAQVFSRELKEELSLEVPTVGEALFSVQEAGSSFVIHFTAVWAAGTPTRHEHVETRWATIGEVRALTLVPLDGAFILQKVSEI